MTHNTCHMKLNSMGSFFLKFVDGMDRSQYGQLGWWHFLNKSKIGVKFAAGPIRWDRKHSLPFIYIPTPRYGTSSKF